MCGKQPKVPEVIHRDPIEERRIADAASQTEANSETANRRRRRNSSGGGMTAAARVAARRSGGEGNSLLAQATPEP